MDKKISMDLLQKAKREAATIHLDKNVHWTPRYKKAFSKYIDKGGSFLWGGYKDELPPTKIYFDSMGEFLTEMNDPETIKILGTKPFAV